MSLLPWSCGPAGPGRVQAPGGTSPSTPRLHVVHAESSALVPAQGSLPFVHEGSVTLTLTLDTRSISACQSACCAAAGRRRSSAAPATSSASRARQRGFINHQPAWRGLIGFRNHLMALGIYMFARGVPQPCSPAPNRRLGPSPVSRP